MRVACGAALALLLAGAAALGAFTTAGLAPLPDALPPGAHDFMRPRVHTRDGYILNRSYAGRWNSHDRVALHDIPPLLREAFIAAEDRRFHEHRGVDWRARIAAAIANAHAPRGRTTLLTTIDADTQRTAQALLQERVRALAVDGVRHAAVLVADHCDGAIRAWVVASAPGLPATHLDAASTPRQPGSTLKPFVYALALEAGWIAATMIDDAPFAQAAGSGQHGEDGDLQRSS